MIVLVFAPAGIALALAERLKAKYPQPTNAPGGIVPTAVQLPLPLDNVQDIGDPIPAAPAALPQQEAADPSPMFVRTPTRELPRGPTVFSRIAAHIKGVVYVVIGFVIFAACSIMPARSDYTWVESYRPKIEAQGWQLIYTEANVIDITRPWTIIWPPPVGLWFIRPTSLTVTPEGYRRVEVFDAQRAKPPIRESENVNVYDCAGRRFAYAEIRQGPKVTGYPIPEWQPVPSPNTPGGAVFRAVCERP